MSNSKDELRDYLRSRRARLRPSDVGLPEGPGRRVVGLRREEIAALAGVSVDYYARLEQGRSNVVSRSVLDAVARALRLTEVEHQHLIDLAAPDPGSLARAPRRRVVRRAVGELLANLTLQPAFVMTERLDVLEVNDLAVAFLGNVISEPSNERNLARFVFLDPTARDLHGDWQGMAREAVAMLRLYAGAHPDDSELDRLVSDLSLASPEFVEYWGAHEVHVRTFGARDYSHPIVGTVRLSYEALVFPNDAGQRMSIYYAEPGSDSERALRKLAALIA